MPYRHLKAVLMFLFFSMHTLLECSWKDLIIFESTGTVLCLGMAYSKAKYRWKKIHLNDIAHCFAMPAGAVLVYKYRNQIKQLIETRLNQLNGTNGLLCCGAIIAMFCPIISHALFINKNPTPYSSATKKYTTHAFFGLTISGLSLCTVLAAHRYFPSYMKT